jgi:tungstate transport system ATP-binding protein
MLFKRKGGCETVNLRLAVSDLSKSYSGNHVLKGCSFSFDQTGVYALMGPNGCGKSTFLRICALIESPDSGAVNYFSDGKMVQTDLELKRRITLVLPKVGVFNSTVFKNAAYGLGIRAIRGSEAEKKVTDALEFVGLMHKKGQNALTLSSGETQRLGIARALIIEPEVLFLDEPTASVDQKNTEIIEDIILKIRGGDKSTVIITTHDRAQARKLADVLLVMKEGKISIEKTP